MQLAEFSTRHGTLYPSEHLMNYRHASKRASNIGEQPSQPSQPANPASLASAVTQPAQPSSLPYAYLTGGEWFLKVLLGVFARVSGGFRISIYQSDFGIDLFFLGKNKAFLAPRCVWCGKTRVINFFGRFFW